MRRFSLLLLALVTAMTVGVAANHRHGHDRTVAVYQILDPYGGWAHEAVVTLTWTGGQSVGETNNHGLVALEAPVDVTDGTLSAELGIYCFVDQPVTISREHPGKFEAYPMQICGYGGAGR